MSDDIIRQIDEAVRTNLCACGCGQQIPARGPSPDFINEKHQQQWAQQRAAANKPAGDWYTRLREADVAHDPDCDPAGCPHHTAHARIASVTVVIHDETSTMQRSTLRKAIDKIRGIRP